MINVKMRHIPHVNAHVLHVSNSTIVSTVRQHSLLAHKLETTVQFSVPDQTVQLRQTAKSRCPGTDLPEHSDHLGTPKC